MKVKKSLQRVCPDCSGDEFKVGDCNSKKSELKQLGGYTLECTNDECSWRGYRLQLVKRKKEEGRSSQ